MSTPLQPTVTVKLAGRDRTFSWGNSAIYRYGCITLRPKGGYATVVAMLWASLVPKDAIDYPSPEHFAEVVPMDQAAELYEQVIGEILPDKEDIEKNGGGSTPRPTPSSS